MRKILAWFFDEFVFLKRADQKVFSLEIYPTNIIHQTEHISSSNKDYGFQVYSLPSKPQRLTKNLLNDLKITDKLDIIYGLCRGVSSIHNYVTPLYLRYINPAAFYIFNIHGKYKPLLAMFEYAKDTANSEFTVIQDVVDKTKNQNVNQFFAPEVIRAHLGEGVDWEKADIYSLAKTCIYILTGCIVEGEQVIDYLDKVNITDEIKLILSEMMSDDSAERPKAEEVLRVMEIDL